jgi:predicted SprT family Zn-dependent metalloprotease
MITQKQDMDNADIASKKFQFQSTIYKALLDTLLHEIAHAITRQRHGKNIKGHGPEWKKVCIEIGAKPIRTSSKFSNEKPAAKYSISCPVCGFESIRHKISRGAEYSCPKCCPGYFNTDYLLTITQNY